MTKGKTKALSKGNYRHNPRSTGKSVAKRSAAKHTAAKKFGRAGSGTGTYRSGKIHIAPPSTASQIRASLGISNADISAALSALDE